MDATITGAHIEAPFAASFPLPFRVLVLIGAGILAWALNLHLLATARVDAGAALDLRSLNKDSYGRGGLTLAPTAHDTAREHARSAARLCAGYTLWIGVIWVLFRSSTHGEPFLVDAYKFLPALAALGAVIGLVAPTQGFERGARDAFLRAIKRCFLGSPSAPVYFSDVVLADVLTSFAKVIGDVWLSLCMILPGGSLLVFPQQEGWSRLMVPCLMSIPYAVRFRQCIIDYMQPTTTTKKSLYNALKYASSFPVIFLSAAQRSILVEGEDLEEHPLFRLWLLSVIVNSFYSFWWDVTHDWGLELLKQKPRASQNFGPLRTLILPSLQSSNKHAQKQSEGSNLHVRSSPSSGIHQDGKGRSQSPMRSYSTNSVQQRRYPWGLRSTLLFPLPIYPLVIFLNLLLRFTWSLKLSAHLHARFASPTSSSHFSTSPSYSNSGLNSDSDDNGVLHMSGALLFFWLELAEIVRRWMWVFLRVEWEWVRQAEAGAVYADDAMDGMRDIGEVPMRGVDREDVAIELGGIHRRWSGENEEGTMVFDAGREEKNPP